VACERAGDAKGAAVFYRKIVNDFPDSPEAPTAEKRLQILGLK
jgi:hypothetical protein